MDHIQDQIGAIHLESIVFAIVAELVEICNGA